MYGVSRWGAVEQRKGRNTGDRPVWIFTILIIVSAWDPPGHSRFLLLLPVHLPIPTVFISHDGSRVGVVIGDPPDVSIASAKAGEGTIVSNLR